MTTRIYERHLCSFKDTNEHCGKFYYFKNFTSYNTTVFEEIEFEITTNLEVLRSQSKSHGELILDHSNTTSLTNHQCYRTILPYMEPEGYEWNELSVRTGDRWCLTDLTMEEYQAMELEWMASENLASEYQEYLAALDQMRNDPAIVWRMDWTLVSTTP